MTAPVVDGSRRRTLVFINGPCGVGKTELAWALLDTLRHSVMLDLDALGAVNPYVLDSAEREAYLFETLALVIERHSRAGYRYFILPYVFAGPAMYARIVELCAAEAVIFKLRLDASEGALAERILKRNSCDCEWELTRVGQLRRLFDTTWHDPDETVVDTTGLAPGEVLFRVKSRLLERVGHCEPAPHRYPEPGP